MTPSVGLSALGYYLPPTELAVDELVASGRTQSDAAKLRLLGFESIRVAGDEPADAMALAAVRDLQKRSGFPLDAVDVILYGGALATSNVVCGGGPEPWGGMTDPLPLFRFPGCRLQGELGLPNAAVMGVAQMACNSFHACLRLARGLIAAEPGVDHVLCVAADRFPVRASREVVYNLMSDGACAAVVSRGETRRRILSSTQITRGAYWHNEASHDQLIAAYFPLARQAVHDALREAGLSLADIALFVPHNLSLKSWTILGKLLDLPPWRIYTENIARIGHVVASDNVINLLDAEEQGRVSPGDCVALFVMGFGAHWSCTLLEM